MILSGKKDSDWEASNDFNTSSADLERKQALHEFPVETIQRLSSHEVSTAQSILRHGDQFGIWSSHGLVPPGTSVTLKSVDLRRRITKFLLELVNDRDVETKVSEALLDEAVLSLSRYLILLRIGPAGLGRTGRKRSLSCGSIAQIAYWGAPRLFAIAIAEKLGVEHHAIQKENGRHGLYILNSVKLSNLLSVSRAAREKLLSECARMRMFFELDLWWDAPNVSTPLISKAMTGEARENELPEKVDKHSPLPDEYTAEMGWRSLWIMRNIGPNLLVIAENFDKLWRRTFAMPLSESTTKNYREKGVFDLLFSHKWVDSDGISISHLPFSIQLPKPVGFSGLEWDRDCLGESTWRPRNYRDILGLLAVVQFAHYFIVALSMGARRSEVLGLQRDCIVYRRDGRTYATGKTYKFIQRVGGEIRDWLLPDVAVEAVERQVQLITAAEKVARIAVDRDQIKFNKNASNVSPMHLWAQLSAAGSSDGTKPLGDVNPQLKSYAQRLRMDVAPGGQKFRSHRFRKTLARLVALALTQAPKLLMDVFGHNSIEATLYYILTDKNLHTEIETVSRELRVMRAKEAVEKMVEADMAPEGTGGQRGGYGGLAAISLHSAVESHRRRVHRRGADWSAESAIELAELLTLQGNAWEQVRRGVICTKLPGEAGPCNKRKGRPEPSKCQSSCSHRLEEAFLREDVDSAIEAAVAGYEHAVANDEALTASHWAGQLRANVSRFPDLHVKWSSNETVRALVAMQELQEQS